MEECRGQFFMRNGVLEPCAGFNACFLSDPFYIYEVFRVIEGVPLFMEDHHARLQLTARLSQMPVELIPADLPGQVREVIRANGIQTGNMKIVVHDQEDLSCPSVFLIYFTEHQYPSDQQFEQGVEVALFEAIRTNPNAKVMDVSLRNQANLMKQQMKVYETLLVDQDGCITEGSRSNVFFIKGEQLITPPLADVLPGVTRKHIMALCKRNNIPVTEKKVPVDSLQAMDGVFISGTSRKVLPVNRIDSLSFRTDLELIRRIREIFNREVQEYIDRNK